MKKIIVTALLCLLATAVFAVDATVVAVQGKVSAITGGTVSKLSVGSSVPAGATISTGFKSQVTLKIDGSVITVKPLTRLKLSQIVKKEDALATELYLDVGKINANVKPKTTKKVDFKVKTTSATASVRGTSGIVGADGSIVGKTGVWTNTSNAGEVIYVQRGQTAAITASGDIEPPHAQAIKSATSVEATLESEKNIKTALNIPVATQGTNQALDGDVQVHFGWGN